jgi:hypothetical protein
MHYHFRHKTLANLCLKLSNNPIRRVFTQNLFISSKLSLKSPKTALLVLALLLLSSSSNLQALNGKIARADNRSDAIVIPSPVINYVRPNLELGNGKYAGPADIWSPDKGFLVQSINSESYNLNFPTTGMDGLYFDLLITGIEPEELTWEPVTHEGITATVTNVVPNDYWIPYKDRGVVARVKLTGPEARNQWENPHPNLIAKPQLPQTFELVGRDIKTNDEVVKYGFVLRQWFVNRGDEWKIYSDQLAWCNGLGYRMSRVRDLTNGKCGVHFNFPCINGVDGATPSSVHSGYQRRIGAGFFTEWGEMLSYPDAGFRGYGCWAYGAPGSSRLYHVDSHGGWVVGYDSNIDYAVCTTP